MPPSQMMDRSQQLATTRNKLVKKHPEEVYVMGGKTRIASLVCMALMVAGTAFAAIPDPATSIVPNVVYNPSGSAEYTVVVNNGAGAPVDGSTVRVVFSSEADGLICWCQNQEHPVIQATTNASGEAVFNIAAGGCINPAVVAQPPAVQVFADGVLLGEVGAVGADAVDQTGNLPTDGWVLGTNCGSTLPDAVFFTVPISTNTYDYCVDFNSDGVTGILDAVFITVPISTGETCSRQ